MRVAEKIQLRELAIQSLKLCAAVIKSTWPVLLILQFVNLAANDQLAASMELIQLRGREDMGLIATVVGAQLIVELLFSALWILLVAEATMATLEARPVQLFAPKLARNLNQLLIETVRAFAAVIYRLPLLIFPAAIEYLRLTFVPLVVLADSDYRLGNVDALERSRGLARGHWLLLSAVIICNTALTSLLDGLGRVPGDRWFWQAPLGSAAGLALTLLINAFFSVFLVALYKRLSIMQRC